MTESENTEQELTKELGKVERHLYRLRKRREEIFDELDEESPVDFERVI